MKRFRLSTLMLLVVIAALVVGLVAQEMRHRRHDAEQQARLAVLMQKQELEHLMRNLEAKALQAKLDRQAPSSGSVDGASDGK